MWHSVTRCASLAAPDTGSKLCLACATRWHHFRVSSPAAMLQFVCRTKPLGVHHPRQRLTNPYFLFYLL
jgi:hypothetical protein